MGLHRRYGGYVPPPTIIYEQISIPDNSIINSMLTSSSVDARVLANGAVNLEKCNSSLIEWLQSQLEMITTDDLTDGCVTTPKIAEFAITEMLIDDSALAIRHFGSECVDNPAIKTGAITWDKIVAKNVKTYNIDDHAVDSLQIATGSIDPAHLSAAAIALFAAAAHDHSGVYTEPNTDVVFTKVTSAYESSDTTPGATDTFVVGGVTFVFKDGLFISQT